MKATVNLLHHQEFDWLRELDFYKQELEIMRKRIEDLRAKKVSKEAQLQLDDFLNQFANNLQKDLESLFKENQARSARVAQLAKLQPENIEDPFTADRDDMHERMKNFIAEFSKVRFYLNSFISKLK